MGTGSCLGVYHKQTPVQYPTCLICPPYQTTSLSHQIVFGSENIAAREGNRFPFLGLGPRLEAGCSPAKSCRCASRRNRDISFTFRRWQAATSSTAAYPPSPTRRISRSGNQARTFLSR